LLDTLLVDIPKCLALVFQDVIGEQFKFLFQLLAGFTEQFDLLIEMQLFFLETCIEFFLFPV